MQLLKKQIKELFDIILENGFQVLDFKFRDYTLKDQSLEYHFCYQQNKDYNFYIRFKMDNFYNVKYSPGRESFYIPYITEKDAAYNWNSVKRELSIWMNAIKTEMQEEDLWTKYKHITNNLTSSSGKNNFSDWQNAKGDFSPQEKINLKSEFDEVKKLILEVSFANADELLIMKEEIENLKGKIDFLNKPDFIKQVIGSLTGYIPKMVSEQVVKEVWKIFKEKFFSGQNLLG